MVYTNFQARQLTKLSKILSSKTILVSIFLIVCSSLLAQTQETDSLVNALSRATEDSERMFIMNELSRVLKDINSDQSLRYAQEALKLSQQLNNKENEIKALHTIGVLTYDSEKIDSALAYFEKGEQMARDLNFKELQADHLMSLANWYRYYKVDSTKTVNYLQQSIEVSMESKYHYGTARSYAKLASFYTKHKRLILIEEYLALSAKYYLKTENGELDIANYYNEVADKIWAYNPKKSMDLYFQGLKYFNSYPKIKMSMAKAYMTIGQPKVALKYLEEAVSNLDPKKDVRATCIAQAQLSEVHLKLGDHQAALTACNKGIALIKDASRSNRTGLPSLYITKGLLMELKGDDRMALGFYAKSMEEAISINESNSIVKVNIALGNFHSLSAPQKAEKYCTTALKKASESNLANLEISACDCLVNIYKKRNEYSKALSYFEKKIILSDSIGTMKIEHAIDINNKIIEKEKQLAEESYHKKIKDQQLKNKNGIIKILTISSIFGLLLIGFLFLSRKKISRQNYEIIRKTDELEVVNNHLTRSNVELEKFAHVASHDLKSPLRTIISFSTLISRKLEKDGNNKVNEWLAYIVNSGKSMSKLIDDILEYSKLSNQDINQSDYEVVNLNKLIDEITQLILMSPGDESKKIEATDLPNLKWSKSKLFLLFKNFIENGLKYNDSEYPTIKIYFSNSDGINSIYFEDNGIGIKEEDFDTIFIMFQRLHNQETYEGTGLGLASCKKIVDDFNGKINITSTFGMGTTFKIEIPENLIC